MTGKKLGKMCAVTLLNYQHLIHTLVFNALLKWTKKIEDKDTLTRLYKVAYDNLLEIQLKYSESFKYDKSLDIIDDELFKFNFFTALNNAESQYQCNIMPIMMAAVYTGLSELKEESVLRELDASFDRLRKIQF